MIKKLKDLFGPIWGVVIFFAWAPLGLLGLWIERTFGAFQLYIYLAFLMVFIVERVVAIRKNEKIARQRDLKD